MKWMSACSIALALCVISSAGYAETVTLTLQNSQPAPGLNGAIDASISGSHYSGIIGALQWSVGADVGGTTFAGQNTVSTFCIQFFQNVSLGSQYTYNVVHLNDAVNPPPYGGTDHGAIDLLAAQQIQGLVDQYSGLVSSNISGAAFQLAVWEIEYDGGSGGESFPTNGGSTNFFTSGLVQASYLNSSGQQAISLANTWLNKLTPDATIPTWALESYNYQDQMVPVVTNIPNIPGVPLPAALPVGLSMMAGMAALRKYRRRA